MHPDVRRTPPSGLVPLNSIRCVDIGALLDQVTHPDVVTLMTAMVKSSASLSSSGIAPSIAFATLLVSRACSTSCRPS